MKPQKHKLKLLIIENNPIVGSGRASDTVKMTDAVRASVEELMDDIEYSSHGLVTCEIAGWEREDGFALHTCEFTLLNGTKSHALDEETFTELFREGWYGWWSKDWFTKGVCPEDCGFTYDYDAMIRKHNIVERRNKGEFNMILLVNIDPVHTYEACMIGRNSYWINGEPLEYDCPLTAVMNVSVSRRDANFECFGHMMEMIMGFTFCKEYEECGYEKGCYNGMDPEKMNLWNRFILCDRNFDGPAGCGNVHFSPNSTDDYDWSNETKVWSTWRDWCDNYPDLTGEAELTNCRAYLPLGIGKKDTCRLHHRWWFYAMPHAGGVTEDGFSNSWWDYFATLDFVTAVTAPEPVRAATGDAVNPVFTLTYRSGRTEEIRPSDSGFALKVTGNLSYCEECGVIRACGHGEGRITVWKDGCCGEAVVTIR